MQENKKLNGKIKPLAAKVVPKMETVLKASASQTIRTEHISATRGVYNRNLCIILTTHGNAVSP